MPVIMGRKTFESMGGKALSGRKNIVITRQADWKAGGVIRAANLDEALEKSEAMDVKEVFVIGGGEIYKQAFDKAQRIFMTRVHHQFEADVFFPPIDESKWTLLKNTDNPADEKHAYTYSFQLWERNTNKE